MKILVIDFDHPSHDVTFSCILANARENIYFVFVFSINGSVTRLSWFWIGWDTDVLMETRVDDTHKLELQHDLTAQSEP